MTEQIFHVLTLPDAATATPGNDNLIERVDNPGPGPFTRKRIRTLRYAGPINYGFN